MREIEARFRRKFEPHPDGYLFRQSDREVIFTRSEVEDLVEQLWRYWGSPALWGGWLIFGVVLPFIAIAAGLEYRDLAIVAAVLANIVLVVVLAIAWRAPTALAFSHPSVGPGRGRTGIGGEIAWLVLCLLQLGTINERSAFYPWSCLIWGGMTAYATFLLLRRFSRWLAHRSA